MASLNSNQPASELSTLPYAVAAMRPGIRLWGVAMLLLAGLSSVVLGGCFLIGVLLTFHPELSFGATTLKGASHSLSKGEVILVTVLYAAAMASFFFAVFLMFSGLRGAMRIMEGRS